MTTSNLKSITQTIIRGEPAVKFPLRYKWTKVLDANGGMVFDMRGWGRLQYHPDGEEAAAKFQDSLGRCFVDIINREAKAQGLY